jgi:3-hydroxyacyl-CoA dehydrogenase / 3-hydroxy-2-methylbutyryl-CoA dehydrogenase
VEEICRNGGYAAILDMNEESGEAFAKELGPAARFYVCDVLDTASVSKAVQGATSWAKETGKTLGGVIPAAGVSTPATVGGYVSWRFDGLAATDRHADPRSQWRSLQPR